MEMAARLRRDGSVPSHMQMRCKDGGWVWLEGHVRLGPHGEMMGTQRDVTEDYRRAAALQQAAQVRTLLSQTAGVGLWRFDPRDERLYWSEEWTRMLADVGIHMSTPEEFAHFCHPDDLGGVLAAMEATIGEGRAAVFDHRLRCADGQWMTIRVHIQGEPLADGRHVVHGLSQNLTEVEEARRELERHNQRLRLALAAAGAAVVDVDFEAQTVWCSPEFVQTIGYSLTYEQATGLTWPCILPEDKLAAEAGVRAWLEDGPTAPIEARVQTERGERWVRVLTEIERGATGKLRRTVSLMIDIDATKRQQLALAEAQQAAQAATEAKSQFLANMSHELRTPMNGVMGVLHLLDRDALPPGSASLVGEALSCGGMLQALLDDIVDFSRIEAGRLELAPESVDPQAVLESVAAMVRRSADEKGLGFELEVGDLPPWLEADPLRLRQCLFNLIGNAIKFTSEGRVIVRAAAVADGQRLRFEVQDTGIGISAEVQATLFERFRQADASTTRRFGGSGLGLAITRRLAELMGGAVGCVSSLGRGATFWLELPIRVTAKPAPEPASAEGALKGVRVLVVEDNPTNRMIAGKLLESLGASVSTAVDGEEGVAAALEGDFDLILMDIQMPRLDGMAATRRIRTAGGPVAAVPIVGLTANVLSHQREAYVAAGMDSVIGKPISPGALLHEILAMVTPPSESAAAVRGATQP